MSQKVRWKLLEKMNIPSARVSISQRITGYTNVSLHFDFFSTFVNLHFHSEIVKNWGGKKLKWIRSIVVLSVALEKQKERNHERELVNRGRLGRVFNVLLIDELACLPCNLTLDFIKLNNCRMNKILHINPTQSRHLIAIYICQIYTYKYIQY